MIPYVYDLAGAAVLQAQYEREIQEHFARYPLAEWPFNPIAVVPSGKRPTEGPFANKGRHAE